jgi:hypothetical protein
MLATTISTAPRALMPVPRASDSRWERRLARAPAMAPRASSEHKNHHELRQEHEQFMARNPGRDGGGRHRHDQNGYVRGNRAGR